MLNRFIRWFGSAKDSAVPQPGIGSCPTKLTLSSVTVGDYARMSADRIRRARCQYLRIEIARLKRNKKRHSHLQQELDRLT